MIKKKLLFFVTEDWYFCSHRIALALAAKDKGYEVTVVTNVQSHGDLIINSGLNLIPLSLSRRSKNPLREIQLIFRLVSIYKRVQPDIVHHVALKPVLYGSIAARIAKVPFIVNAMAGLGFLFTSQSLIVCAMRPLMIFLFRLLLNRPNSRLILQNPDDVRLFANNQIINENSISMIRGSGVDVEDFYVSAAPVGVPLVVLASRLLWDKGIGEFVEAARQLALKDINMRMAVVGEVDPENPSSIPESQIEEWKKENIIEFWGHKKDMRAVFSQAHIVCLPSYREGLPKVLLEAAACGLPIVTTDAIGCREIVRDGVNGYLVPIKDAHSLACALKKLIQAPEICTEMGKKGRELVESNFSLRQVNHETLALYEVLLH